MSNHPPAEVLAARLEHQLHRLHLLVAASYPEFIEEVSRAQQALTQLREAMK